MEDLSQLLDALYYHHVLGAPDQATARANLDRVLVDVTDLRDTLDLYGIEALAEAMARGNRSGVPA